MVRLFPCLLPAASCQLWRHAPRRSVVPWCLGGEMFGLNVQRSEGCQTWNRSPRKYFTQAAAVARFVETK